MKNEELISVEEETDPKNEEEWKLNEKKKEEGIVGNRKEEKDGGRRV